MQNIFIELSTEKELLPLFEIYKDCMYLPTKEKYKEKILSIKCCQKSPFDENRASLLAVFML